MSILQTLKSRGFVKQIIDEEALEDKLENESITFYVGFDPTGNSLHVGHLLPIMVMAWLQRAGHTPIVVLGGGTAMVGDPSGKDKTREMLTTEKVEQNLDSMRPQYARFLDLDNALMLNNADWLMKLNYVDFLRDIGKHFSVNRMIKAEGTRQRLEREQGFSFIEFNYHLLQSYDFLHLHKEHDCILQVGGDDQWFHFCGGVELIRRETGNHAYGFTIPLLTTANGKKMGKTENGAVWLDPKQVSPYDYYQYWVNVQDDDVIRLFKLYTFLPLDEIAKYEVLTGKDIREAKQRLAYEATKLAHGEEEAKKVHEAARKLFSGGGATNIPTTTVQFPISFIDLLEESGLAPSKSQARRLIKGGGIKMDYGTGKEPIKDISAICAQEGNLWAGKKRCVKIQSKS
jgi:tyrosyl-tRNA synthetase